MKRVLALILAIVTILTLTACSSGNDADHGGTSQGNTQQQTGSQQQDNGQQQVDTGSGDIRTITWWTVRIDGWGPVEELIAEYNAANPNIKVELIGVGNLLEQLIVSAPAGELPELWDSPSQTFMQQLSSTGAVVDIDEFFKEIGYDRMLAVGLEFTRLPNGKLHNIAWENNVEYFWYHPSLFEQAGITRTPETFDELLDVAKKLDAAGIVPFAQFPGWHALRLLSMIPFRLSGNEYLDELMVGNVSMGNPIGMRALQWFQEIAPYFQPGWATATYGDAYDTFMGFNGAMWFIGSWQFASFLDENQELLDDFDFFPMPTLPDAITGAYDTVAHSGTGTAITATKFDDDVRDFVVWMLDHYPQKAFEYGVLPAMTFDTDAVEMSSFFRNLLDYSAKIETPLMPWDVPMNVAANIVLADELVNLGIGVITADEFVKRVDAAIAENPTVTS